MFERKKNIGYRAPQYSGELKDYHNIPEIVAVVEEYKELAQKMQQPVWPVKRAALYFTYNDEYYVIYPGNLATTDEIFECLVNELTDDIFKLGAYDMFYSGMLD